MSEWQEGHYHLHGQLIKRSLGHSSVAAAAYRSGSRLVDERTGEVHDYARRGGVAHAEILLPEDAPDWMADRAQLWNHVEQSEKRKDAQLAREMDFGIPHQLNPDQRLDLVRNFLTETFVAEGMVADFAIHTPQKKKGDDPRNVHAHVLLSLRMAGKNGFYRTKTREWNARSMLDHWRAQWATYANRALEQAGHNVRLDHRSYKDRGIEKEPQIHIGRKRMAMADKEMVPRERPYTPKEKEYVRRMERATPRQARWMNHPQSPWARVRRSIMYKRLELGDRLFRTWQILDNVRRGFSMKEQDLRARLSMAKQQKHTSHRAHKRALFNMRKIFDLAYKNPGQARVQFQTMVDRMGFEKAYEKLLARPDRFGARKGHGLINIGSRSAKRDRDQGDQALKWLAHRYEKAKATAYKADTLTETVQQIRHELNRITRQTRQQAERQRRLENRTRASELSHRPQKRALSYNSSPAAQKAHSDMQYRIRNATLDGRYFEADALRKNAHNMQQPLIANTPQGRAEERQHRKHQARERLRDARERDRGG